MKKIFIAFIIAAIILLGGCTPSGTKQEQEPGTAAPENTVNIGTDSAVTGTSQPAAGQTEEKGGTEEVQFGRLENVFGFADESGKYLITLQTENADSLANPQEFNTAVGNNGETVGIRFVRRQEANSKDTLRQTANNFDNMAGYIYEARAGEFIPNKTYLLSQDSMINEAALINLKSTKDTESEVEYYKKADPETIERIEALKGRKIIEDDLISETEDNAKICLFTFERRDDDMLASIAYIKGDKVMFMDYPAKYDEMSTWRVDAGDRPGLFEVLFLANSDEGLLLGLTWAAPEGENAFVLREVNGAFEGTDLKSGRYWAP